MDGYRLAELIAATENGWFPALSKQGTLGLLKTKTNCPVIAVTAYQSGYEQNARKVGIKKVI